MSLGLSPVGMVGLVAVVVASLVPLYSLVIYPLLLVLVPRRKRALARPDDIEEWPSVTLVIPVYNGEDTIGTKLDQILDMDYPSDKLHVLVVSDASSDGTDEIVKGFADRGVELLRLDQRGGKTAAENAARSRLRGDIVFSTDAAVTVDSSALKYLVAPFQDPEIGVTTGRIISVRRAGQDGLEGESWYNSFDMSLRRLETSVYGVVGAAGAIFASRRMLHEDMVPSALSRDFAAPLIARERGYRSALIPEAVCYVGTGRGLKQEYRRKVRTMTRGIETFYHKIHLANPFKYGVFAWMLLSHKVARWLIPVAVIPGVLGLALLATENRLAAILLLLGGVVALSGALGLLSGRRLPRPVSLTAFGLGAILAGIHSWYAALRGELNPIWEPTKRGSLASDTAD